MGSTEIANIQHIFTTRLDTLDHIIDVAEKHLPDIDSLLNERLAPDMFPLGTQIAFACNQPLGFAQWCSGQLAENLDRNVLSIGVARSHIANTTALVRAVKANDSKLDQMKRTDLGPGLYCETPARLYVSDFLIPNFYFHITTTYAILRKLGVPLGKANFMAFLMPHVRQEP
jgi:uncharacterized protein